MCLAVPGKVIQIENEKAVVEMSGVRYEADLSLLDDVQVGDSVLLHAGFAIQKLDPEAAAETLEMFEQLRQMDPGLMEEPGERAED